MKKPLILSLFASLILALPVYGQQTELSLNQDYSMTIEGTSNVQDWSADITSMDGVIELRDSDAGEWGDYSPEDFLSLELRIRVGEIETDSRRLTRNLRGYLEEDDHPIITFRLQEIVSIEGSGDNATIRARGTINAAGQNHKTSMELTGERSADGTLQFSGSQPLKMTDFDIDPPTAMLGAIRAVDDITIHYTVRFN